MSTIKLNGVNVDELVEDLFVTHCPKVDRKTVKSITYWECNLLPGEEAILTYYVRSTDGPDTTIEKRVQYLC